MLSNRMIKELCLRLTLKALRYILILLICNIAILLLLGKISYAAEEFVYDSQGRPDPFTPWVTPDGRLQILRNQEEQSDSVLKVQGIMYDKYAFSYAIVNEQVVKIGDVVDDYQVLKIEENKVIFIKEGQIKELEWKKEE